jgi:multimeric flavodoxin WrbA
VETDIYSLAGKKMAPCLACDRCETLGDCVIEDDFQELRDRWVAADAIIYSVPVFHMGLPGQLKCFIDRLGNSLFSTCGAGIAKSLKSMGVVTQGCHIFAGQEHVIAELIRHAVLMGCVPMAGDLWQSYIGAAGWTRNEMGRDALRQQVEEGDGDAQIAVEAAESLGRHVVRLALLLKTGGAGCRELLAGDASYGAFLERLS